MNVDSSTIDDYISLQYLKCRAVTLPRPTVSDVNVLAVITSFEHCSLPGNSVSGRCEHEGAVPSPVSEPQPSLQYFSPQSANPIDSFVQLPPPP